MNAQAYKNEADKMCERARKAEAKLAEAQRKIDCLEAEAFAGPVEITARTVADRLKALVIREIDTMTPSVWTLVVDTAYQDLAALVHAWVEAEEICRAEAQEEDFRRMKDDLRESRARLDAAIDDILHRDAEGEKDEAGRESADHP
jgi:hypothetical protein